MTVSADEIHKTQQNPETELEDAFKNLGIKTSEASPRGVLDIPISDGSSVSDSPKSSSSSSSSSSCSPSEKPSSPQKADEGESGGGGGGGAGGKGGGATLFNPLTYGIQFKGFFDIMKRKSGVRRLSTTTINLLSNYDLSAKSLRKKLARIRSAEDSFDCGLLSAAKPSWRNFKYSELAVATDHFSPGRLLGKGGHAEVYKGCLPDGTIVAVKRLTKKGETEDEERTADFLSELGIIAHVDHPNTASLVGFSVEGGLYLVLQFAPNGSIESYLQGSLGGLDWTTRLKVAVGVAEGLSYLHHTCQRRIIHRDIKASNILLAEDYEPLISDFGLAKWLPEKWLHHVVYPIEGTFGYLSPEYFMHGIADEKTDVFAYGVVLLEIITGRHAVAVGSSRQSLVMWAKPFLDSSNMKEIADPNLGDNYDTEEMKRMMAIASMCIHHTPSKRPFMNEVVELLQGEGGAEQIKEKSNSQRSIMLDACDLEDYTSSNYLQDLNRHKELVME
ncbi:receptor-like cytosolic serine/threonine-protein kinase RBK1 [Chenopodium quinoa]|uniref:receptor-like cytosolic serine/threonine-protein kinase RBK1 n=1 Tax=Chenopodium quinoa TaxID=63459 RepID=UPI000B7729A3|nr:receptor-like cytosolic serine/threonine-protein kinase RBK1 [Chenopodium quinoa]